MANLTQIEKIKLEKMFDMEGGFVLDFSNSSFQRFISTVVRLNIYSSKYENYGTSKANRLRAFWETESDLNVGKVVEQILLYIETQKTLNNQAIKSINKKLYDECLAIAFRLQGKQSKSEAKSDKIEDFLKMEVDEIPVNLLKIDGAVIDILENRIVEIKQCLKAEASLSVIFLCGSVLEGILLGIATKNSKEFNQSNISPKDKDTNKVRQFHEWTLNNFIDVAHEIGFIGLDVKKYSHSLRDFRNYIHPYQQMSSGFKPDLHTAKISWQVLKAAIHDLHLKSK